MIGVIETAGAIATFLAPFMPYLKEAGKIAGKKLVEVIAEKGGDAAWQKAKGVWAKITGRLGDDPELASAAGLLAAKPDNATYQTIFATALASSLEKNPEFSKELLELMGGEKAIQEILAERGSWIEDVKQEMEGSGRQTIKATDDSVIKGATQTQKIGLNAE
jgi:hypothetical protein